MKTIAIDASRAIRRQKTGVEWYAWHLIKALALIAPADWRVKLLAPRPFDAAEEWGRKFPEAWRESSLDWPPKFLWSQIRLAAHLKRTRPDLFFSPVHVLPFFASAPAVVTIHDTDYMTHPEAYSRKGRAYLKLTTRWAVARAARIITPSNASKENLTKFFGCDPRKIRVTALGPMISRVPDDPAVRTAKDKFCLSAPYFIFVGRLEAKKNTARIVEAFSEIGREFPEIKLVLVGRPGRGYEKVRSAIERAGAKNRIIETGWLAGNEVAALTRGALGLIFASLAEGFGLPVLDGFFLGTPVITSRGISTEEVAGSAAVLVDPNNAGEISAAMRRIAADENFRRELAAKGLEQVKNFSWQKTAVKTVEVFNEVIG